MWGRTQPALTKSKGVSDPHNHGIRMSHVLIVEDEAHLAKGLQYNLEAEGHSVSVVGDGERALDLLLGKSSAPATFDAVVLDVMLPGKDGFTVAAELRAAQQFVPVLMLTARGRPDDVLKGFEAGADDYLPCLLYTSPSPRDRQKSRMPSSA